MRCWDLSEDRSSWRQSLGFRQTQACLARRRAELEIATPPTRIRPIGIVSGQVECDAQPTRQGSFDSVFDPAPPSVSGPWHQTTENPRMSEPRYRFETEGARH